MKVHMFNVHCFVLGWIVVRDLVFGKVEEDCNGIFQLSRTLVLADNMGWHVQVCNPLFSITSLYMIIENYC